MQKSRETALGKRVSKMNKKWKCIEKQSTISKKNNKATKEKDKAKNDQILGTISSKKDTQNKGWQRQRQTRRIRENKGFTQNKKRQILLEKKRRFCLIKSRKIPTIF